MYIHTSVRRFRKAAQLAQHELAELLGIDQSRVSRIEAGELPEAAVVLGLQALFDHSPQHLFSGHYQSTAEEIVGRAAALDLRLQRQHSSAFKQKRAWLRAMMNRVTPQPA